MSDDLSARISRAQLDIDTAALRQRIAELEADNQALGASISQAGYDSYEQSIRNRELREKTEAAEKITRELSVENAGLRRQLYDANAELERLRAERWEPILDPGDLIDLGFDAMFEHTDRMDLYVEPDSDTAGAGLVTLPANIRLCRKGGTQ